MERLTGWKQILLVIIGIYVVIAIPLIILDRLHIFSFSDWLHLQSKNQVTYTEVTNIVPAPSGDPFLQPVQPSGAPYATVKRFGRVATLNQKKGATFLSVRQPDNEQIKEVLALTPNADIEIIRSAKKGKSTVQVGVLPDEIKIGDDVIVTYQIDVTHKTGSISAVTIFR